MYISEKTGSTLFTLTIIGLCIVILTYLTACSSDSGSSTTSTTSGSTVAGAITGFGSIIMDNGVEYETDGLSDCEVDDQTATGVCEDSLSTGMHVTLHTDSNNVVTALKYDDELEGVASNVTGANGDYSFEVYGVTITTTNPGTQWDDFSANPPTEPELNGANVEISGEWQQDGTLIASYVEKQDASDDGHEVKGTVGAITGTDFPLTLRNGSTIDVDGSALNPLPAEGDFVELKGNYNAGTFVANESEIEDESDFYSDSEAEITGTLISNTDSSTGFSIGNTDVDISNASSCTDLVGLLVEAEGTFNQDTEVLIVDECENEHEDLEVKCVVVDNATIPDSTKPKVGSVECGFPGTTGGPLTIEFNDTPDLAMFSGDSTDSTFDLTNVLAGDCVEIKFSEDASGAYIAGLIEHEGSSECSSEVEGTLDSFNDDVDITALGVTFSVDSTTVYNSPKTTLVSDAKAKIKDSDADGTVDEIEAEVD